MVWTMFKYRVSADEGETWTEQWLTETEAREEVERYGYLCERVDSTSFKKVFA